MALSKVQGLSLEDEGQRKVAEKRRDEKRREEKRREEKRREEKRREEKRRKRTEKRRVGEEWRRDVNSTCMSYAA